MIAEELIVSKRIIQETKHFTDTIQCEEAHPERRGNTTIQGDLVEEIPHRDRKDVHGECIPD